MFYSTGPFLFVQSIINRWKTVDSINTNDHDCGGIEQDGAMIWNWNWQGWQLQVPACFIQNFSWGQWIIAWDTPSDEVWPVANVIKLFVAVVDKFLL